MKKSNTFKVGGIYQNNSKEINACIWFFNNCSSSIRQSGTMDCPPIVWIGSFESLAVLSRKWCKDLQCYATQRYIRCVLFEKSPSIHL